MEAKHTSGPWRATPGNSQMSDPGTTVYHCGQWGVYSDARHHGDAEADARLIAAAPELLEVLQEIVKTSYDAGAVNIARAAIAKATQ